MTGSELKLKRKEKGWTQEQLAQRIGVSKGTVINYEKGNRIPDSKNDILKNVFLSESNANFPLSAKLDILSAEFKLKAKNKNNPSQYILQEFLSRFHPVEIVYFLDKNRLVYFELEEFRLLAKNAVSTNEIEELRNEIKRINKRLDNL